MSAPSITPPPRRQDAGAVLAVVLLMMVLLMGLGITALWLTSGNVKVSANINLRAQALYVAEAGLERARAILDGPVAPDLNAMFRGGASPLDEVPTGIDDATGEPNGVGAVVVDGRDVLAAVPHPPETFGRGAGTVRAPTSTRMGTYTVWIRNDTAECRLGRCTADGNGMVVVRSQGVANDGRTTVVIEGVFTPLTVTPPENGNPPVLCHSGKNACDDNNSVVYGVVVD